MPPGRGFSPAVVRVPSKGAPVAIATKLHAERQAERRAVAERKQLGAMVLDAAPFWLEQNPTYQPPPDRVVRGLAAYGVAALAYICMRYRATKLIEARLWIRDETDDGEEWLTGGHELEGLLEQPNPDMTHGEFWELVSLYLDAPGGGACLLVKNRDSVGRVVSLYPFPRGQFDIEPTAGRLYGRFRVILPDGTYSDWLTPDDVIYLREADPRSPWAVLSPGDAALTDLNLSELQRTTVRSLFRQSMLPGSVTAVKGEYSDEQWKRFQAQMGAEYAGVLNAGRNMLIEGEATWNQVKASLKEFDYGPLADRLEASICAAFGLHPVMVGLYSSAAMSGGLADSIGPATEQFYDRVQFPRWERTSEKLTQSLLRGETGTDRDNLRRFLRWDTTNVRALQEDVEAKLGAAAGVDFLTDDEKRVFAGWKPMTPEQRAELDAQRVAARPEPPPVDGDDETGAPTKRARRPVTAHKARVRWTDAERKARWARFDTKAAGEEDAYARAARALFAAEAADVARRLLDAVPDGFKARALAATGRKDDASDALWSVLDPYIEAARVRIAADYAPGGEYHEAWLARYRALIGKTVQAAGDDLAAEWGFSFTVENPRVRAAIRRRAADLATFVGETSAKRITDVIDTARSEGVGMREIAKRIKADAFGGDITTTRATLIARTETVGALNEGEHVAALDSDVLRSKRWLSQRVGDARPEHVREEGAGWVRIDEAYPVTGKQRPHDAIGGAKQNANCRCGQLFDDREPDEVNAEEAAA